MRRAAEVAAVRAAEAGEDFSRAGNFPAEHLQPAYNQGMLVRHWNFRLAQQPPKVSDALLAADVIRVRLEHLVLQHSAVAAQHDLAVGSIFPNQRHGFLHLMHHRHQERNAHIVVALLKLLDEFAF
jgi:hypothetical protein